MGLKTLNFLSVLCHPQCNKELYFTHVFLRHNTAPGALQVLHKCWLNKWMNGWVHGWMHACKDRCSVFTITFDLLSVKCNGLFSVLLIANLSTAEPQLSPLPLIPFLNICSPLGFKIKYYSSITTTLPNTYFYKLYCLFLLLALTVDIPRLRHWTHFFIFCLVPPE